MEIIFATTTLLLIFFSNHNVMGQGKRVPASLERDVYIEVEKGAKLHVTDMGEGKPIVLMDGWPLSDAMYEHDYKYLGQKGFCAIGITEDSDSRT